MNKTGPAGSTSNSVAARSDTPSLLFTASDLPRIRATLTRPEFATYWRKRQQADLPAEELFLRDEMDPASLSKDLNRADTLLLRSAFVNAVAPDANHVRLARLALARILEIPRWDWFLEDGRHTVGIMICPMTCVATVLASDWLGGCLSNEERDALARRFIAEDGPACARAVRGMTHHDPVAGWTMAPPAPGAKLFDVSRWPSILDQTNLRVIATAGLAAVASFLKGRHPAAEAWARESRDSLRLFASRLPADQSFGEGPGYWDFTFTYYILALELLRQAYGFDERGTVDFPAMARYAFAMAAPTRGKDNDCINYGDTGGAATANPLTWIAREYRDGTAQALVLRPGAVMDAEISCCAAIWFDPTVPPRPAADLPLDRQSAPGLIVSRSGWHPGDSVVSLRCGGPANHEHADRNSVIFMAHGERLLHDPFGASYSPFDPKWLLRQTAAHTALLIDGRGHVYIDGSAGTHDSQARARLVAYEAGLDTMRATSDATEAYALAGLPVERVRRTVIFLKPAVLVIWDDIALAQPLPVQARFQVFNDDGHGRAGVTSDGFRIDRPAASLVARVAATPAVTTRIGRIELPGVGDQYPFAEIASAPAREHRLLTVCTAAPAGAGHGELTLTPVGPDWLVRGTHLGQTVALRLSADANSARVV